CLVCLAAGLLFLWGGWVLWMKTNRLWRVQVVVHAGGLVYNNEETCLTCRWDQIEEFRWRVWNLFDESTIVVGVVPIATRSFDHSDHKVTVRRKDGVQLIFTDELQNIDRLARVIQQQISRNNRP